MNTSPPQSPAASVSLAGLLGVTFIVLKLANIIAWSWWWVLAPFWAPVLVFLSALVIFLIIEVVKAAVDKRGRD